MTFVEFLQMIFSGNNLALIGAGLATFMAGIGSAKGVNLVAKASAGLLTEDPSKFGKTLALQALPMTQGIYGFIVAFLILLNMGAIGGEPSLTISQGAYYLMASLPIAIVGFYSGIKQGKVAASGIALLAKRPKEVGKAITSAALVETYAIFAVLVSLLLVLFAPEAAAEAAAAL